MSIFRLQRRRFFEPFGGCAEMLFRAEDIEEMEKKKASKANNTRRIFRVLEFYLKFKSSRFSLSRLTA